MELKLPGLGVKFPFAITRPLRPLCPSKAEFPKVSNFQRFVLPAVKITDKTEIPGPGKGVQGAEHDGTAHN